MRSTNASTAKRVRSSSGPGKIPTEITATDSITPTASSRGRRSGMGGTVRRSGPRNVRSKTARKATALSTTPITAMSPSAPCARKAPSMIRSSPGKPLVPGTPIDASPRMKQTIASRGTDRASPVPSPAASVVLMRA